MLSTHGINSLFCDDRRAQSSVRFCAIPYLWEYQTACNRGTENTEKSERRARHRCGVFFPLANSLWRLKLRPRVALPAPPLSRAEEMESDYQPTE